MGGGGDLCAGLKKNTCQKIEGKNEGGIRECRPERPRGRMGVADPPVAGSRCGTPLPRGTPTVWHPPPCRYSSYQPPPTTHHTPFEFSWPREQERGLRQTGSPNSTAKQITHTPLRNDPATAPIRRLFQASQDARPHLQPSLCRPWSRKPRRSSRRAGVNRPPAAPAAGYVPPSGTDGEGPIPHPESRRGVGHRPAAFSTTPGGRNSG